MKQVVQLTDWNSREAIACLRSLKKTKWINNRYVKMIHTQLNLFRQKNRFWCFECILKNNQEKKEEKHCRIVRLCAVNGL